MTSTAKDTCTSCGGTGWISKDIWKTVDGERVNLKSEMSLCKPCRGSGYV